ncbi:Ig-like domain repeat protein, partial [Streptomyces sp. NPDC048717]|uniref:RCC1 domain-containing protein n=1 Tax=Streptomyces sp. NPDC048717 TaxID=3154928 RepID=UPI0034231CE8
MKPRTGSGGRTRTLLRALVATLAGVLCVAGFAAPHANALQAPPTDIALSWGRNNYGQLGIGTAAGPFDHRTTPVNVHLPAGVELTAVSGGGYYSLGLASDGRVLGWGTNDSGQTGDGTTVDPRTTPVFTLLPDGVTATAIAAGFSHALALTSEGRVLAWGYNGSGQLGDGTTTSHSTPVEVHLPAGVTVTAIGAGATDSMALASDGRVFTWGSNGYGQLGIGTSTGAVDYRSTPVEVLIPAGTEVTAIAAGASWNLALTSEGRVLAWGFNSIGQLGDGTFTNRYAPVETLLPANTEVTLLAAGSHHTLALTSDDRLLAWGSNGNGQLGDGTTTNRNTPVSTDLPAGTTLTALAGGGEHSLALTSQGRILAWGSNNYGQLGDGTTTDRHMPISTLLPAGNRVTAIAAGLEHSLALVGRAQSMTTLTAYPGVIQPGQDVTFTADVICSAGTPTGDVVFYDGTDPIGTGTLDASGSATLTAMFFSPGAHTITAHYQGDGTCPASVSEPVTVTVLTPEPGASLGLTKHATSTGPFEAGDTVEYTYTVTNTGEAPLSSVTVTDNRVTDVDCEDATLAPGESTTCRGTYTVTEADAVCGPRDSGSNGRGNGGYGGGHGGTCPVTNTAQASATDTRGDTITS